MRQQLSVYVMATAGYCGWLVCGPPSVVAQTSTQRVAQATSPLFATAPLGDPNRLFIVEQGSGSTANIRILNLETGDLQPTPFLTVRQLVTGGERGLLGLAFHPDFATNGLFYTNQTTPGTQPGSQDDGGVTNIVEWHVDGDPLTSDTANPAPVRTILTIDQPFQNHNGGWLAFSPIDRLLYIATGDGGSGNDPQNAGQRLNTLLAKMLRVDVNGDDFPEDDRNYVVPASNPFANDEDDRTLAEIWAYGLRNPFRSSFDRGDSTSGQGRGDLYIGDVGQNAREEINLQPTSSTGGENYGWRLREGTIATPQVGGARPAGAIDPIYDYSHGSGAMQGNSVTGGYVYRGSVKAFEGLYFFADFVSGNIWTLDPFAVDVGESVIRRNAQLRPNSGALNNVSSFGEDADGELYIVSLNGGLFRVVSDSRVAEWNGDDPQQGSAGDGTSWNDAQNWSRDGVADAAFVSADEVVFKTGSSQTIIDLQEDRSVSGVVFESDYTLSGNQLRVLSGNILVEADVTATIDSDLAAEVSGSSLRKRGEGTLVVNGQAGQTVVLQGTVAGQGAFDHLSVYPGGSVTPGIAGVGQLSTGGYVQRPGGRLMLEIRADNSDLESDLLASSGQASLSGELWVQPIDGYADPAENGQLDEFTLVAGSITGAFDTVMYDGEAIVGGHQGEGLFRLIEYHDDRVQWLNYRALAGDANGDRAVDFEDFTILADSFAQEGEWTDGDFDGDGIVQFPDFTVLADGFGSAVEPAVPVAVPEPGGFVLLLAASGAGLVLARRRAAY